MSPVRDSIIPPLAPQVLSKLRRYSRNPNFLPEKVAHYSEACRSFCQWVLATQHYGEVYRVVQPKRQLHHKVTLQLRSVQSKLQGKEAQLEEVGAVVWHLRRCSSSSPLMAVLIFHCQAAIILVQDQLIGIFRPVNALASFPGLRTAFVESLKTRL